MTPAELIAALIALAPMLSDVTPERAGRDLGVTFALTEQTEYAESWTADGQTPVAQWELRLPKPGAQFDGLLNAQLDGDGLAEADLAPLLAPLPEGAFEVISPPLDGPGDWVPMSVDCRDVDRAQICVTWLGLEDQRATAISLSTRP